MLKILVATLVATTIMTASSYIISKQFQELYKEPVLLNKIMQRLKLEFSVQTKRILAWFIHYLIGLAFVFSYDLIWTHSEIDPTWFCGIVFGIISGFVGIAGWMLIFRLPSRAPKIDFKGYYIQLFFVHVIFALAAVAVYKIWQ